MDKAKILKIVKRQEFIVAAFSLLVFIFFSLFSDNFYTPTNLRLILQQYAVNGICVLGISIVIILNGIDLSAGAILAMAGAVSGTMVKSGVPVILCILAGVALGMLFSFINALIITKCRVPAIVTTIATNYLFRGLIVVITGGYWVNQFPKAFTRIGAGRLFGISNLFWMAMLLLIVILQQLCHSADAGLYLICFWIIVAKAEDKQKLPCGSCLYLHPVQMDQVFFQYFSYLGAFFFLQTLFVKHFVLVEVFSGIDA